MSHAIREACYREINECMRVVASRFIEENKAVLKEANAQSAIDEGIACLDCIFAVLDKYEIRLKVKP